MDELDAEIAWRVSGTGQLTYANLDFAHGRERRQLVLADQELPPNTTLQARMKVDR